VHTRLAAVQQALEQVGRLVAGTLAEGLPRSGSRLVQHVQVQVFLIPEVEE
jgi:hypothetical protein